MENRRTAGFTMTACLSFFVLIFIQMITGAACGEELRGHSTMFALGSEGIAYETLLQYTAVSLLTGLNNHLWLGSKLLQNKLMAWRSFGLICAELILVISFIFIFRWFPTDEIVPWITFGTAFVICLGLGFLVMFSKLNWEKKKYERLLQEYKESRESED